MKRLLLTVFALMLWCIPAKAQDFVQNYNFINTGTTAAPPSFANTGITSFFISWQPQVTLVTCAVQVDSSADGVTWGSGDLIASQNCATAGSSGTPQSLAAGKNFIRVHVTALTGNGGLNVSLKGWGGGSGGGSSTPTPGSQISFGVTVSPLAYGAKWDGKYVYDAQWSSSSQNITCPNNDCGFTAADVGKIMFGTMFPATVNGCSGITCGQVLIAQGTITAVNSASSIQVSTTSSAACTPSASNACGFAWATQDDAPAIRLAEAAAWTNNSGHCFALELPSGMAFVGSAVLGTVPAISASGVTCGNASGGVGADASQSGPTAYGQGAVATTLMPLPNFNFTTCTNGGSGLACFGGSYAAIYHDFAVNGLGNMLNGTTHNNKIFESSGVPGPCASASAWNLAISQWGNQSTNLVGLSVRPCFGVYFNVAVQSAGETTCQVIGSGLISFTGSTCYGANGGNVLDFTGASGSTINTYSSDFGFNTASSGANYYSVCGTWNSQGDAFPQFANVNALFLVNACLGNITLMNENPITMQPQAGGGTLLTMLGNSGSTVKILNTPLNGGGANGRLLNLAANNTLFDLGGNTFTSGSVADIVSGVLVGSYSVTGTTNTAAKMVLSAGWGTTAAWTLVNGSTQYTTGTITASGTGQLANPTITYTFPTPFPFATAPTGCFALQVGGTQAAVATPFTPSALSATGVTFTYNGTPGAGSTLLVQIQCWRM